MSPDDRGPLSRQRRAVVTGAAGFVGARLTRALAHAGHHVTAVDDLSAGSAASFKELETLPHVEASVLDVRDSALHKTVEAVQPDTVIHLAAVHYIPECEEDPERTRSINVEGTRNVAAAASGSCVRQLIFASTADVYAPSSRPHTEDDLLRPPSEYGRSKLEAELTMREYQARRSDVAVTILRPFNIYGPGDTVPHLIPELVAQIQSGGPIRVGNLTTARDYTYVEDVVRAIVVMIGRRTRDTVNIGTGVATTGHDVVHALAQLGGRPFAVVDEPTKRRRTDRPILQANTDRIRRIVPYWPRVALADGLLETLAGP